MYNMSKREDVFVLKKTGHATTHNTIFGEHAEMDDSDAERNVSPRIYKATWNDKRSRVINVSSQEGQRSNEPWMA